MSFDKEYQLALEITQVACLIAQTVANKTLDDQTQIKKDRSPVTVADYAVQAYVIKRIHDAFPDDEIVGEEDTKTISDELFAKVKECVNVHIQMNDQEIKDMINLGNSNGGMGRKWVVDPIDGTAGYLRRQQYAVCLGFMVDGDIKVGALGCPNYDNGTICVAQKGKGAKKYTVNDTVNGVEIHVTPTEDSKDMFFVESVDSEHSDHKVAQEIAKELNVTKESLRMDSQAKYMAVALGHADVYLRLPQNLVYRERIWDHSSGFLIVREAGGEVTDVYGQPLDFTAGRRLFNNHGIICSNGKLHNQVTKVVSAALQYLKN